MTTGALIAEVRLAAGLSQSALARRAGTSQATISAYESGDKSPSAVTLERLVAACGRRLTTRPAPRTVLRPGAAVLNARGRILAEVLDLAERLPATHKPTTGFPGLPRTNDIAR